MTAGWNLIGVVLGVLLVGAGLAVVVLTRRPLKAGGGGPTRLTTGLVCLFVGYHLLVWSVPTKVTMVAVPIERWMLVVGGSAAALLGSLLADWLEQRNRGGDHGPSRPSEPRAP